MRALKVLYGSMPLVLMLPNMRTPVSLSQDRFRAALLGFAIGDALGFPFQGGRPQSLRYASSAADDYARHPRGEHPKGQFSDDTQLMLAVLESVVAVRRVEGRSLGEHLGWLWQEGILLRPSASVARALERLAKGSPWMSAGCPVGDKDPSVLSRAVVLGLWNSQSPDGVLHGAQVMAVVTHKDPTCAAAVAVLARAIALGMSGAPMTPASWCESLARAASAHDLGLAQELEHLPTLASWSVDRALTRLRCVSLPRQTSAEHEGLPRNVVPVLLTALYAVMVAANDFRRALGIVLSAGGEVDACAGACGALLGASGGCEALPSRLRKGVQYAEHLLDASDRLFQARHLDRAPVTALAKQQVRS
ncbi:MAG TPA: ADP-ribosylglycohydrolase family protein [Myxococcaceae bacterium]|nr:ADP-ribosylglycohydrolase family protein [Myxococcaceae bacterium]